MDKRSWLTQRFANYLPLWSQGRQSNYSVVQQLLNPVANELGDLYRISTNEFRNQFLSTANTDLLHTLYKITLDNTFGSTIPETDFLNTGYIMPTVTGVENSISYDVELVTALSDLGEEGYPTSIQALDHIISIANILPATEVGSLDLASFNAIPYPNQLIVTVADGTNFVDYSRRQARSYIVLTGITVKDTEETEIMSIVYNGNFITKKVWKELTSIDYYGITPETATIQIDNFGFNLSHYVDKHQLMVDVYSEKLLYHRLQDLNTSTYLRGDVGSGQYSILQLCSTIANSLNDLYNGVDTLDAVAEIELMYDNIPVQLTDIALQPFTGRIFGIDGLYLYIYEPSLVATDCRNIEKATSDNQLGIVSDQITYIRTDTITFQPEWRKRTQKILKNRWSIKTPSGTIQYLDIDSNVVSANNAWIFNDASADLVFGPFKRSDGTYVNAQRMQYTFNSIGTYQIILEFKLADGTMQTEIMPVTMQSQNAIMRYALPSAVQGYDGITFDYDQNLWIGDSNTSCTQKLKLRMDYGILDYESKLLFLRELYDTVSVVENTWSNS